MSTVDTNKRATDVVLTDDVKESLTIEEAVNKIVPRFTVRVVCFFLFMGTVTFSVPPAMTVTAFAGHIPYDSWECLSTRCEDMHTEATAAGNADDFISLETMCDNDFVVEEDFNWVTDKPTFSIKWKFYCGTEWKLAMVSSMFFVGSIVGLLTSTAIYDQVGRRRGAILGCVVSIFANGVSAAADSWGFLIFLRIVAGFGVFIHYTGSFLWIIEFAPTTMRNPANIMFNASWTTGYALLVIFGKYIDDWRHIYLAVCLLNVLCLAIYFIIPLPESARYYLIKGREEEAKKTLATWARVSRSGVSLDNIHLVYDERKQNPLEQVKDFRAYPTMLKETLLGMFGWTMVSTIVYAYEFGWDKLGNDLYSSYAFFICGDVCANLNVLVMVRYVGRKKATIFYFIMVLVFNCIAMIDAPFNDEYDLSFLASILGSICAGSAFIMMYLYSSELAPTSHRGMIICCCSIAARIGSIIGPYIFLLNTITDRRVALAIFSVLAAFAAFAVLFLPETHLKPIPETPKDVDLKASLGEPKTEDAELTNVRRF